mmetsp:Transcript_66237/g.175467  ORF Transcript_66237/g.175467 Transcript_66237/m.175467 type:complete len:1736 (-) Transcript_66237:104-5311(-)
MERYWVPHKEEVFAPCWYRGPCAEGESFVEKEGDEGGCGPIVLPAGSLSGLAKVQDVQLVGVNNICTLPEVTPASMLHTVRVRYVQKQIYTTVSKILIAVNPFQSLNIYSSQYQNKYMAGKDSLDLDPHVYGVGLDAVAGLRQGLRDQAVLISGESGSGKTETTKLILSYIASAISGSGGIEEQILRTNPVLESFGNAMTVRNNNSSRFGKWLEISVTNSMNIGGCSVTDYLLELTRVCKQGAQERNYHIFFALIASRESPELKSLALSAPENYKYLEGAQVKAPGIDDAMLFDELKDALAALQFSTEVQTEIFRTVAGVLTIGNISFVGDDDSSRIEDQEPLKQVAELLRLDEKDLRQAVSVRKMVIGKDVTTKQLGKAQANNARDSLAKLIYGRLFKWLVHNINKKLGQQDDSAARLFGVLDIAGFESFDVNSLEQLCINLSNEHLQQHFNCHVFKLEIDDYRAEGLTEMANLSYEDNTDVLNLIDSRGGIMALLDEEITVPKATDATYVNKVVKTFEKHERFKKAKFSGQLHFGIVHFAGEVQYQCDGFLEKNQDKPPEDASSLFASSKLSVLQDLAALMLSEESAGRDSRPGGRTKTKTVCSKFRSSLQSLMTMLNQAEPHFIRCVKPNMEKLPGKINAPYVMQQLTFSGIMEAVRIRQQGFASRMLFEDFYCRFKCVLPKTVQRKIELIEKDSSRQRLSICVEHLPAALSIVGGIDQGEVLLGSTKVFVKATAITLLEKSRDIALSAYAVDLQRAFRGMQVRKMVKRCQVIFVKLQEWVEKNRVYLGPGPENTAIFILKSTDVVDEQSAILKTFLEQAHDLPIALPKQKFFTTCLQKMEAESAVIQRMEEITSTKDPLQIDKVLGRAKNLELPQMELIASLEDRCKRLRAQLPVVKAMNDMVVKDWDLHNLTELCAFASSIGELAGHDGKILWIDELGGAKLFEDIQVTVNILQEQQRLLEEQKKREAEAKEAEARAAEARAKEAEAKAAEARASKLAASEALAKQAQEAEEKAEEARQAEAKARAESEAEAIARSEAKAQAEAEALEKARYVEKGPEEKFSHRKSKRQTMTGLDSDGQQKILIALTVACEEFDALALEESLSEAIAQGLPAKDLATAERAFEQMQTDAFLTDNITRVTASVLAPKASAQSLRCLANLVQQAQRLNLASDAVAAAKPALQHGVKQRMRTTLTGDIFSLSGVENLHASDGHFDDLANFRGLKSPSRWKGHRRSRLFKAGSSGAQAMLSHSKNEIKEALTTVSASYEIKAMETFRDILGWMCDRVVPECQRLGIAQNICDSAKTDTAIGDETYVQVMKQLTNNPSKRSALFGWKLMLLLCQQFSPSEDLSEFVRAFLVRSLKTNAGSDDICGFAQQCITELNIIAAPEAPEEERTKLIPVQVLLIDNSTRKIHIDQHATLEQLGEKLAEQMKISRASDFSFYQVIEGMEFHRLMTRTTELAKLSSKWQSIRKVVKKPVRLLWKRRFLHKDEILDAGDLIHATLTYRQALWEYLRYPFDEDIDTVVNIAAMILFLESDHYAVCIRENRLHEKGVLEQLLPDRILSKTKRNVLAPLVSRAYSVFCETVDDGESRLQKMCRFMSMVQKMEFFGTHFWSATQVVNIAQQLQPLPEVPSQHYIINPKSPSSEVRVCVDTSGVRFVPCDPPPSYSCVNFSFDDRAQNRVLTWGTKHNILQFIVSDSRVKMTINLMTAGFAVDIAYACFRIQQHRRGRV